MYSTAGAARLLNALPPVVVMGLAAIVVAAIERLLNALPVPVRADIVVIGLPMLWIAPVCMVDMIGDPMVWIGAPTDLPRVCMADIIGDPMVWIGAP